MSPAVDWPVKGVDNSVIVYYYDVIEQSDRFIAMSVEKDAVEFVS